MKLDEDFVEAVADVCSRDAAERDRLLQEAPGAPGGEGDVISTEMASQFGRKCPAAVRLSAAVRGRGRPGSVSVLVLGALVELGDVVVEVRGIG
ncbi:hypothetical protein ACFXKC_51910, partial [Streptomyces sp. NPDC059340]|uniref:hypothetical protein n=1 Tax=Streptomyces sp. NPDC059340 TaxID=3346806 RepID=UPI0036A638EA